MTDIKQSTPQARLQAQIQSLQNDEDFAAALDLLKTSDADLGLAFVALERAAILHRLDRNTEALAELDKASFAHNHLRFWRIKTRVLIALGHLDQAEAVIRDKNLGNDEIGGGLMFSLGRALLEDRQFERAASYLSKARLTSFEAPALIPLTAQATLLTGDVEGFNAVLDTLDKDTSVNMVKTVRQTLARLLEGTPDADMVASSDKLVNCTLQSLHRLDDPLDARTLADILYEICDLPTREALMGRIGELARKLAPASIRDIATPSRDLPPDLQQKLPGFGHWLGSAETTGVDWPQRVWDGLSYKQRLATLVTHSDVHRAEMKAFLPPMDWSEVRACHASGQPVLLVALHCHFRPAIFVELNRLDLGVKIATNTWLTPGNDEFHALFFDPPAAPRPTGLEQKFSETEIMRNILRHLKSGGVAGNVADGFSASRKYLPEHDVHVNLSPPHWKLARRTGAAVFWIESGWRDGQLQCSLTRWDVPDGSDLLAEEALWYDRVITAWRSLALADPRNVLPAGWFLGSGSRG